MVLSPDPWQWHNSITKSKSMTLMSWEISQKWPKCQCCHNVRSQGKVWKSPLRMLSWQRFCKPFWCKIKALFLRQNFRLQLKLDFLDWPASSGWKHCQFFFWESVAKVKHDWAWSPNGWVTIKLLGFALALRFLQSEILCWLYKTIKSPSDETINKVSHVYFQCKKITYAC